jgi:hypothetical protein
LPARIGTQEGGEPGTERVAAIEEFLEAAGGTGWKVAQPFGSKAARGRAA